MHQLDGPHYTSTETLTARSATQHTLLRQNSRVFMRSQAAVLYICTHMGYTTTANKLIMWLKPGAEQEL